MTNINKLKKAFSLIEVIFVLIILGIVASIGSSIIVQVYENYITQNTLYQVSTKAELVANQIVNRLSYAIPRSTISKVTNDAGVWINPDNNQTVNSINLPNERGNWIQLKDIMFGTSSYKSVEWIGYDNDSFTQNQNPNWSGIANYNTASRTMVDTPGSNLGNANNIIFNLSQKKVTLNAGDNNPAIFFKTESNQYSQNLKYHPDCMGIVLATAGLTQTDIPCAFRVNQADNDTFNFLDNKAKKISERYQLSWSAFAIVPELSPTTKDIDGDGTNDLWDLYLYSNYQPWEIKADGNNERYIPDGTKHLLMKNVTVFKFTKNGGIVQFKLCAAAQLSATNYISTCKEKVILR